MLTALGLSALVGLILANGYFVAAEFAYVAARSTRLRELAAAGDQRANRALAVRSRLSFMLSGAQLGITATSLLVGFIAEPTLGRALQPLVALLGFPPQAAAGIAFSAAFVTATGVQMVFGELGPKNLAIARPEPVALALARGTHLYTRVMGPLIGLFDASSNRLLRAVGIDPVEELAGGVSPEELEVIIERSGREGTLTPTQATLLGRALEFRSLRAVDAMVPRPRVVAVAVDASCADLQCLAVDSGHSRFPAVAGGLDDVEGVVQAKDVLGVAPEERATTPVRTLLQPPLVVPESALLGPLLTDMRQAHTPLAVVVDEYGGTAGIVTLEDIVEELVGDIEDEYDAGGPTIRRLADGSYLVPGTWRLDELERDTGVRLPVGDYDTVGGLVMERLGRVPRVGDALEVSGVSLRVDELRGLAVARVRLSPAPARPDQEPGAPERSP